LETGDIQIFSRVVVAKTFLAQRQQTARLDTAKPPADQFEQTSPQIKERKGQ
jgi:hypothetical protein